MNCTTVQCVDEGDLLPDDQVVAFPSKHIVWFFFDDKDEISGYNIWSFVPFLRECDFRAFLPSRPHIDELIILIPRRDLAAQTNDLPNLHVLCSQFQMDALCLRERDLLNRFVADVLKCKAKGENTEQAFNSCYELAKDLGRAFSERAIFQTFVEAESTLPAGSLKDVLGTLRSLYASICIEDVSFLRYGYLSVDNGANVRREITELCNELRPHALALISSFGIPDAFLSPIAFNWTDTN